MSQERPMLKQFAGGGCSRLRMLASLAGAAAVLNTCISFSRINTESTTTLNLEATAALHSLRGTVSPWKQRLIDNVAGNSTSMRILLTNLLSDNDHDYDDEEIILKREAQRCGRYNFNYINRTTRRRIFAGGMLADDSFHVLGIHAMEARGIYTNYAFVESNRTHTYVPRTMRFQPYSQNKRLLENIFGEDTKVTVDYYMVDERGNLTHPEYIKDGIFGQQLHRNVALSRWKEEGMGPDDIGIILDVDEMFSRDFLRALQICDIPEFQYGQNCRSPKIHARGLFFDASLRCARNPWGRDLTYTPTAILGECIEGIGDEKKHGLAKRVYNNERIGYRQPGYGGGSGGNNWSKLEGFVTNFPLWNAVDFRRTSGGRQVFPTHVPGDITGFHVNNFFLSAQNLRFKFSTYGEPKLYTDYRLTNKVFQGKLSTLAEAYTSVKKILQCVESNLTTTASDNNHHHDDILFDPNKLIRGNFTTPQALRLLTYVEARHHELIRWVEEDKNKYG